MAFSVKFKGVHIVDIVQNKIIKTLDENSDLIYSVFFTEHYLLSGGDDEILKIYEVEKDFEF